MVTLEATVDDFSKGDVQFRCQDHELVFYCILEVTMAFEL